MSEDAQVLPQAAIEFYQETIGILLQYNIPFLVGGAYAFSKYTGIERYTKDFDVFLRREDCPRALIALQTAGYKTQLTDEVWIAKAFHEAYYVDLIFSSANGVAAVDEAWFEFSVPSEVVSKPVLLVPAEEMIWQKAFIMERDRFDGADVAHMIYSCAKNLDWARIFQRFEHYHNVLFAHLVLFSFIYPSMRELIPGWIIDRLIETYLLEQHDSPVIKAVCNGRVLAPTQYRVDVDNWGYLDGRPVHAQR